MAELGLLTSALAVQPGIGVSGRGVRVVAPPLAVEVALAIAPTAASPAGGTPPASALG